MWSAGLSGGIATFNRRRWEFLTALGETQPSMVRGVKVEPSPATHAILTLFKAVETVNQIVRTVSHCTV